MRVTRHPFRMAAIGLFFAGLSACSASTPFAVGATALQLDSIYQGDLSGKPAVAEVDGQLVSLYATADNRVAFKRGDKVTLLDAGIKAKGGRFFELHQQGGTLYALWWNHQDAKALYCAVSTDGGKTFAPTRVVNSDHGVLPPYTILTLPDGAVGVAYMDERSPKYEVYFNRSGDAGKTWDKQDQRLDTAPKPPEQSSAMFPSMVQSGADWVVVWTDHAKVDGQPVGRILVRTSSDAGRQWSPEKVILQSPSMLYSVHAETVGNDVVVMLQDTLKGVIALRSTDHGRSWTDLGAAPGTQATNNSGIRFAGTGATAYAVWMAQKDAKSKGKVFAAVLDLASGKWAAPEQVDAGKPEGVGATLSLEPSVAVTGSGVPVITWTDFRNIRPNIYLSASFDHGKTWTAPQDVELPGQYSSIFSSVIPREDSVLLSYERFPADDHKVRQALVIDVKLDKGHGFAGLPQPKAMTASAKEQQLKDRVAAFWKERTSGDFAKTYGYFDPAFKMANTPAAFVKTQGNFVYHSAKTDKITVEGNVAQVSEKINYEVKPTEIAGQEVKVPPTTVDLKTTWVWIYDNWYQVYTSPFGQPYLQY